MRQITEEAGGGVSGKSAGHGPRPRDGGPTTAGIWPACPVAGEREAAPGAAAAWRSHLLERGYTPGTINTMLVSLNRFFGFLGWNDCQVKTLRIQRRLFRMTARS